MTIAATRHGIYFASKTKHAQRWIALRGAGVPVISTWIDEAGVGETSDWQDLWDRCLREASTAAALVMYVEPGETHKGSLAEVGAALRAGVPMFWVGPEVGTIRRARGVTICETIEDAIDRASTAVEVAEAAARAEDLDHEAGGGAHSEHDRLRDAVVEANNVLFDVSSEMDDPEHVIECHANALADTYRRLAVGAKRASAALAAVVLDMVEAARNAAPQPLGVAAPFSGVALVLRAR